MRQETPPTHITRHERIAAMKATVKGNAEFPLSLMTTGLVVDNYHSTPTQTAASIIIGSFVPALCNEGYNLYGKYKKKKGDTAPRVLFDTRHPVQYLIAAFRTGRKQLPKQTSM